MIFKRLFGRGDDAPAATGPADSTLYTLVDPLPASRAEAWAPHYEKFDQIVGWSHLGHLFMRSSADQDTLVLHPFKKAGKSYGAFASVADFETQILRDPGFAEYVLRADHVAAVRRLVGPLAAEEVYIPQPYPFMGGSDRPDTYGKGNVWVFLAIVAQMQGL